MSNGITSKGVENGRAEFAYKCALSGKDIYNKKTEIDHEVFEDKNYKSYVKKIPMLIKTNGLGATFAYVKSKKAKDKENKKAGSKENCKNGYDLIYTQTSDWLISKGMITKESELIAQLVSEKCSSSEYRRLTIETLALFNWLKRFADGLIEGEENESMEY
jgi:CRISPR-associated protein Cmr5